MLQILNIPPANFFLSITPIHFPFIKSWWCLKHQWALFVFFVRDPSFGHIKWCESVNEAVRHSIFIDIECPRWNISLISMNKSFIHWMGAVCKLHLAIKIVSKMLDCFFVGIGFIFICMNKYEEPWSVINCFTCIEINNVIIINIICYFNWFLFSVFYIWVEIIICTLPFSMNCLKLSTCSLLPFFNSIFLVCW